MTINVLGKAVNLVKNVLTRNRKKGDGGTRLIDGDTKPPRKHDFGRGKYASYLL